MATRNDYRQLLLGETPLFDVRAPIEFNQGAFPGAVNLPLMNDSEREQVGTCYKQQGPDEALALGHQLVNGELKARRVAAWHRFATANPDGCLYCFRGGQRSQISQQWLREAGIDYPYIEGGYKALRRFILDETERLVAQTPIVVVGGMTGCGKTLFLEHVPASLDLEGLAHHRGSSFGQHATPQPSQINFEHQLAIAWLRLEQQGLSELVVEDEGKMVGSVHLPFSLHGKMQQAPLMLLEASTESRIECILDEYVHLMLQEFCAVTDDRESGFDRFAEYLSGALWRIRKRLGAERYGILSDIMTEALAQQKASDDISRHRDWIRHLLVDYYDPMYRYQLAQKEHRVILRGDKAGLLAALSDRRSDQPASPAAAV